MNEFEQTPQEDTLDPPSKSLRAKEIPSLGVGLQNKINWKGVGFIGAILVIAGLALFWWRGGFSGKKPTVSAARDEIVNIPSAPKKLPLVSTPKPPASAPEEKAVNIADDNAIAIELRRKRTGQIDVNGKPITGAQGAVASTGDLDPNKIIYKQYGSNKSISKNAVELMNDPAQSLVKRRALDSGGVGIFLGGAFLPKSGPSTSQYANLEASKGGLVGGGLQPDTSSSNKPVKLQGDATKSGTTGGASSSNLAAYNTSGLSNTNQQLISDIINTNNREKELVNNELPSQSDAKQAPQNDRLPQSSTNYKLSDSQTKAYPASLARSVPINPSLYMAQGTAIRCVVQTMIISDLDGPTMCNVAEDIRSFDSKYVLIPKGSRVMGEYKAQSELSLDRIAIVWKRLITPDNIDIAIDSSGTNLLGAIGVEAGVDNRIPERILPALFISLFTDAFKIALIKNAPTVKRSYIDPASGRVVAVEDTFNSTTVNNADSFVQQQLANKLKVPARLTVLQGKLVNILTVQDLDFSNVYAWR
jgi:type IV secretory pathway VirB10-like protein